MASPSSIDSSVGTGAPNILDQLADAATPAAQARIPFDSDAVALSDFWKTCLERAQDLTLRFAQGEAVALFLTTTIDSVATLVGAWIAGLDAISLPPPPVGADRAQYRAQLRAILDLTEPKALHAPELPPQLLGADWLPAPLVLPDRRAPSHQPRRESSRRAGRFVQFTSGSTAAPSGVLLSTDAIGAAVAATLEIVNPGPRAVSCSWLPLSHDMGLIGMCLSALVGIGRNWAKDGRLVLIPPAALLRRPGIFLDVCSEFNATITASSVGGMELATLLLQRATSWDLSRLQCWIVGAEVVHSGTVSAFCAAAVKHGLNPRAVCPSYGLAEAALTVALTAPASMWSARPWPAKSDTHTHSSGEVVSCGPPVRNIRIAIGEPVIGSAGEIIVDGPSLLDGYLDKPRQGEPHATGDLGFMADGDLFVIGRVDDVICAGDGILLAPQIERHVAASVANVRRCAAVTSRVAGPHSYDLVVETRRAARPESYGRLAKAVADAAFGLTQVKPGQVILVPRGTIPLTHSGKLRRNELDNERTSLFEATVNDMA
jgi:fatty-acyl-CoA synthase